jgi:multicomponent Na+:H+ antiporter subunit D
MSGPSPLTPLPVAVPLLGAAILAALRKWLGRTLSDSLGILFAATTLILCFLLLIHAVHGTSVYWFGNWYPRGSVVLGIGFVVDTIGAGLATLAALLTFLALVFSWRFVDSGSNHFQPLMLVFLAAMCGFSLTGDLFNLFVFFELMSTAAFALCGLKTAEPAPLQGSLNFAVTNTIAAFLILTGVGLLYAMTGALNMAQIGLALGTRHDPLVLFAFTLLTCGFLIKGAIVPFHLWLPDAHAVAPTPVCVLFSGLMVELGLYAVMRLNSVIFAQSLASHSSQLRGILIVFAGISVVISGLMCYSEHHLKRLLAFSTVCHSSLMLLAFAMLGPLAVAAMLTYLLAHALIKSGLFFVTGIMLHRLRSVSERTLFGKGVKLHWTAVLWFLGAIGLAAAPPFSLMLGEAGASRAAELAGMHGIWIFFVFGGAITSAAVLRVGAHTFFGWGDRPVTDRAAEIDEVPETKPEEERIFWYHFLPTAVCILGALALTFVPEWLQVLRNGAAAFASQPAYLHTVYTGQNVAVTQPSWRQALPDAALHGAIALLLAILLAANSIFRLRFPRKLRFGSFLEGGLSPLRTMQSGHPGDYVMWITVGLAVFGLSVQVLLR